MFPSHTEAIRCRKRVNLSPSPLDTISLFVLPCLLAASLFFVSFFLSFFRLMLSSYLHSLTSLRLCASAGSAHTHTNTGHPSPAKLDMTSPQSQQKPKQTSAECERYCVMGDRVCLGGHIQSSPREVPPSGLASFLSNIQWCKGTLTCPLFFSLCGTDTPMRAPVVSHEHSKIR